LKIKKDALAPWTVVQFKEPVIKLRGLRVDIRPKFRVIVERKK